MGLPVELGQYNTPVGTSSVTRALYPVGPAPSHHLGSTGVEPAAEPEEVEAAGGFVRVIWGGVFWKRDD